jgi:ParB-like chromosome segregation protein Spo0J
VASGGTVKIKMMSVDDVKVAPYNPRVDLQPGDPEYEALRNSIERFGIVDPLVWNTRTKRLVGGHQRFKIIRDHLKHKEVPVVEVSLDDEDEKALNIALNKIQGRFDDAKLSDILRELNRDGYDATITGYGGDEIKKIIEAADLAAQGGDTGALTGSFAEKLNRDSDTFEVTFGFPKKILEKYDAYVQEKGKAYLTQQIIEIVSR